VLFGGILTKYAGWEWVFFVNVPVAVIVLALTRSVVRESRVTGMRGFDIGGAVTITTSLALLVYGISKAGQVFGTRDGGESWVERRLPAGVGDCYAIACG